MSVASSQQRRIERALARRAAARRAASPPIDAARATWEYRVVAAASRAAIRVLFRPHAEGVERLPPGGGFVLCSNQLSNLDGFALAYCLYPRQARWMAKAEVFLPGIAAVLRRLGLFPVRRGEGDVAAVATAAELARSGNVVGIFPEGTRRLKGRRKTRQPRAHTGAARVALAAGVPLIPAAIAGTEQLRGLRRWRVAFGSPLTLDDLPPDPRAAAREATRRLMAAIAELEDSLRGRRAPRARLHPRLRLDLSLTDVAFALGACVWARRRAREARVLGSWAGGDAGMVSLSVRSAFDALLEALQLAPGDEIAYSAVTHPDMVRIAECRGLKAVPIDVDPDTAAPTPAALSSVLTPRTRVVVVAHLFGTTIDLRPLAEVTRRAGALLVEDCAQSFRGPHDAGDGSADVSLFSFGPIKTATALGGALVRIADPALRARVRAVQDEWPEQRRREYAARALKFLPLVILGRPRLYALFAHAVATVGRDLDAVVTGAVRGFPHGDLTPRIRRRPAAPLLAMLERRLRRFDEQALHARAAAGSRLATLVPPGLARPARAANAHTYWLFPVNTPDPHALVRALRRAGFDAATATSSITVVAARDHRPETVPHNARRMMSGIVFVPVAAAFGDAELQSLADTIEATADGCQ